jgi:hypothetical protein
MCRVTMATNVYTVMPNICGSQVRTLLHVTLLAARILAWVLRFYKICKPQQYISLIL